MNFLQKGYKGKNDWWMYVVMLLIIIVTNVLGQIPITIKAYWASNEDMERFTESAKNNFADLGIDSNLYLFLILLSFVVPFIFFYIVLRAMHRKRLAWVLTAREKIDWKRVGYGALVWGILTVLFIGGSILLAPENYVWNFKPIPFLLLCLVSILVIPFQTTFEEVLFRGYYVQGLALWMKSKWLPMLIMSVVFGTLHMFNPEIDKLGDIAILLYIATGIFFGITTLLDEGAELAIGMHAINNILAALFVTTDWTVFQTDALYVDISEPHLGWEVILPVVVMYPLVIFIFSKKYGWKNWQDKLFGKVHKPINQDMIDELGS